MSYNIAQIQGLAQQYGLPGVSSDQAQGLMNSYGGGNEQQLNQYFQQQQQQQQATQTYQSGINNAVTGLQGQQSNLSASYGSLLQDVMGQGTVAMNTATSGENAYLGARGLLSQGGAGNTQMSAAQLAVQAQNQAASGSIGQGSASDISAIQQAIAGIQAGGAGTLAQLPLEYGSLAMAQTALPSQIALTQSQSANQSAQAQAAQYLQLNGGQGDSLFNTNSGSITGLQAILKQLGYNLTV